MGKTLVITGTASGFGRSTVQRFAAEGWNVVATVRKEADLEVHSDLEQVRTLLLDVNDEAADTAFAATALDQFGRADALVNNAGYYQMGPVEASTMQQVHDQFQTNVFGLIALTKAFLPAFRQQRSGVIVNLSSISADQGYPYTAVYAASKAAVAAFTEGLNVEMSSFGVSAKAIFPGQHSTRIFTKIDSAAGVPEDYREAMAYLLRRQHVRFRTGGHLRRDLRSGHRRQGRSGPLLLGARCGRDSTRPPTARFVLVLGGIPGREHRQPQPVVECVDAARRGRRRDGGVTTKADDAPCRGLLANCSGMASSRRPWVRQTDVDRGHAPGVSISESARVMASEQGIREIKKVNEIL